MCTPSTQAYTSISGEQDVTKTKGNDFEDYLLKRELLMGIYEKGFRETQSHPGGEHPNRPNRARYPRPSEERDRQASKPPLSEAQCPASRASLLQRTAVLTDAVVSAGKTAAFTIPLLERIDTSKNEIQGKGPHSRNPASLHKLRQALHRDTSLPRAIASELGAGPAGMILVPTRELALQTSQVCKELGKHLGVEVMVTTGGTSLRDDIMRLHAVVHVMVATPGRILDLAMKEICQAEERAPCWSWMR